MTQAFFQMCEASKGVSDLFSNSGVEYKKFHGYAAPPENEQLDVDINSPELVRRRFARLAANFFQKHPRLREDLADKLPAVK